MNSALITGASSYLGTRLTALLGARGVEVHAIVRPTSNPSQLEEMSPAPSLHVHEQGTSGLVEIVESVKPDVVFHLATSYRREHELGDVIGLVRSNIEFGTQLLEAMARTETRRLVNTGSYFQMFRGDRPLNLYAATKNAFREVLEYYRDAFGIEDMTLILYDIYGPGDRRGKLMSVIQHAQQAGEPLPLPEEDPILDLVFVDDAAAAFLHAAQLLEDGVNAGQQFAVRSSHRHRLREVVEIFEEVGDRRIERADGRFAPPTRRILDPWEGELLPGWKAEVSLQEGIRRLLAHPVGEQA